MLAAQRGVPKRRRRLVGPEKEAFDSRVYKAMALPPPLETAVGNSVAELRSFVDGFLGLAQGHSDLSSRPVLGRHRRLRLWLWLTRQVATRLCEDVVVVRVQSYLTPSPLLDALLRVRDHQQSGMRILYELAADMIAMGVHTLLDVMIGPHEPDLPQVPSWSWSTALATAPPTEWRRMYERVRDPAFNHAYRLGTPWQELANWFGNAPSRRSSHPPKRAMSSERKQPAKRSRAPLRRAPPLLAFDVRAVPDSVAASTASSP